MGRHTYLIPFSDSDLHFFRARSSLSSTCPKKASATQKDTFAQFSSTNVSTITITAVCVTTRKTNFLHRSQLITVSGFHFTNKGDVQLDIHIGNGEGRPGNTFRNRFRVRLILTDSTYSIRSFQLSLSDTFLVCCQLYRTIIQITGVKQIRERVPTETKSRLLSLLS